MGHAPSIDEFDEVAPWLGNGQGTRLEGEVDGAHLKCFERRYWLTS
ncbi:hypothetical protein METHB2_50052 [Candidatus Methylobacter favarea]|uniref:Uncharacterized protein n=1 Tax=Candidatus Methylobacter favarea TaxID=2707345 RepID=A0A8S0XHE6_9GAMM|nr:hypothetical protein METHB2_50052 [Candidatus Methylobacter favarea]